MNRGYFSDACKQWCIKLVRYVFAKRNVPYSYSIIRMCIAEIAVI